MVKNCRKTSSQSDPSSSDQSSLAVERLKEELNDFLDEKLGFDVNEFINNFKIDEFLYDNVKKDISRQKSKTFFKKTVSKISKTVSRNSVKRTDLVPLHHKTVEGQTKVTKGLNDVQNLVNTRSRSSSTISSNFMKKEINC